MTVPDPWAFLLGEFQTYFNSLVDQSFPPFSAQGADGNPAPNYQIPADMMRLACTIQPDDTVDFVQLRLMLFFFVFMQQLPSPGYLTPVNQIQESGKAGLFPKILLYFKQKIADQEKGYKQIDMQVTVNLHKYTAQTITTAIAINYAQNIRKIFIQGWTGGSYFVMKGANLFCYKDPINGYNLRVNTDTEASAIDLFKKILQLDNNTFDINNLSKNASGKMDAFGGGVSGIEEPAQEPQDTVQIMGVTYKKPRWRPSGKVYFQYAELYVPGKTRNMYLTGINFKPIRGKWLA